MKKLIWLCFLSLGSFAFSCEDEDPFVSCTTADPINELPWLADMVAELQKSEGMSEYIFIEQANYKDQMIFIFSNCCHQCIMTSPVYNCQGTKICDNVGSCSEFHGKLTDRRVIFQPENSQCEL